LVNHCGEWLVAGSGMTHLPQGTTGGSEAPGEESVPESRTRPSDSGEPFGVGPGSIAAEPS